MTPAMENEKNPIQSYEAAVADKRQQNQEFLRNLGLPQITPKAQQQRSTRAKKQLFRTRTSARVQVMSDADSDVSGLAAQGDMVTWNPSTTKAALVERFPAYKKLLEDFVEKEDFDGACLSELTTPAKVAEFMGPDVPGGLRIKISQFVNERRPAPDIDLTSPPKRARMDKMAPAGTTNFGWESLGLTEARAHIRSHNKPLHQVLSMSNDELRGYVKANPAMYAPLRRSADTTRL